CARGGDYYGPHYFDYW
nr:immunoglobulin heavy chain junction region [Mus musculus]NSM04460.1 immunoglobulin heavy chain junction region [Mus musculus]NSM04512.1 immunoglobulin heavy chain junction region [Mus musculus]NSM04971.1 immunoglobulin heavy chain junction region [Mus musculus]NSM05089.1 immunoglobulin heavy chain junction region [Mus musculus]